MGAPYIHADLSVKRYGGKVEDYLAIHELMDSSKQAFSDLRHRALTHNSWFITTIVERIFGKTIQNSEGEQIAVRDIAQWHVMEDYNGSLPSASDFLEKIAYETWMNNGENGEVPPSQKGLPPFDKKLLKPKRVKKVKRQEIKSFNLFEIRGCAGSGRID